MGQVNYPKVLDEDSGDALSPEQPASQDSQSSVPSPGEHKVLEMSSPGQASAALPSNILQVRCRYEYRSQVVLHGEFLNNPSSENCCKYLDEISCEVDRCGLLKFFCLIQIFPTAPHATTVISTNDHSAFQPSVTPITPASSRPGPTLVKVGALVSSLSVSSP